MESFIFKYNVNQVQCWSINLCCNNMKLIFPCDFSVGDSFFFFPRPVVSVSSHGLTHTPTCSPTSLLENKKATFHATQVCTTQVGPFFFFLRNYETNVLDSRKKKKYTWWNSFHQTNRRRRRKERRFSHYLVSVKNRNSPVTFTLHFLIIYIYVHGFLLIICHCP